MTTMANTLEPTKQERRILKEIIKKGNPTRYHEWLNELVILSPAPMFRIALIIMAITILTDCLTS